MKCFLPIALCVVMSGSVALAGGGLVHKPGGKVTALINKAKQASVAILAGATVLAAACGLTGCDQGRQMTEDVIKAEMGDPVKFGVIYEHEFPSSFNGAKLAAAEFNSAGGISGRYVEIIPQKIYVRDKAAAVSAAENLIIHDEVLAVIGANYSTISEFIDEVASIYGVPMVTIGSTSATLTRASENVFLAAFPDSFQGYVMAKLATEDIEAETAAVIFWKEDAYSKGLAESFRDSFSGLGGTVVAYRGYSYETTRTNDAFAVELNESGIIEEVVAAQPGAVFIPGFTESAVVAAELRNAGEDAAFLGADGWGVTELVDVGGDAVKGAYFSDHFTADAAPEFTENYLAQYGVSPDGLAALGYDALRVVGEAAQRASDDLRRPTLRDEIQATENYMGATSIARYDDERHPVKSAVIFTINEDGEVVFYKIAQP